MRAVLFVVSMALATSGCSKFLKMRVFNLTARGVRVCSSVRCGRVDSSPGSIVVPWGDGAFEIESAQCTRRYLAKIVEPLDLYRESRDDPLSVVLEPDYSISVLPRGQLAESDVRAAQPPGYPLKPESLNGPGCS